MQRKRSLLLLILLLGVAITWATAVGSGRLFDTYAYVFDAESSADNSFTAATMEAPTLDEAEPDSEDATVLLSWTFPAGDPASHVIIQRADGDCANASEGDFEVVATVLLTAEPYTDDGLDPGTYCYRIKGKRANWTSPVSNKVTATITAAACSSSNTGFLNPSSQAADGDGFEVDPTNAFADGGGYAENNSGPGDRHIFSAYGISIPSGCNVTGIQVRLDAHTDTASTSSGTRTLSVELSWDGGANWTTAKTTATLTSSETTYTLPSTTSDLWGHAWTISQLSNANFAMRVTSNCTGSPACGNRDFFLDWIPVKVYYGP